jgi:hypothetical protein
MLLRVVGGPNYVLSSSSTYTVREASYLVFIVFKNCLSSSQMQ